MALYMPVCGLSVNAEWPDCCSVNLYEGGQSFVGWHADDEDLFQGKHEAIRIIAVSLGQTRDFELRPALANARASGQWRGGHSQTSVKLHHGDVCTMEGFTQKHYQHRLPPGRTVDGIRINLTWRWTRGHTGRVGRASPPHCL